MAEKILLNREQIKTIIPHREPFLLIDEVVQISRQKHNGSKACQCR